MQDSFSLSLRSSPLTQFGGQSLRQLLRQRGVVHGLHAALGSVFGHFELLMTPLADRTFRFRGRFLKLHSTFDHSNGFPLGGGQFAPDQLTVHTRERQREAADVVIRTKFVFVPHVERDAQVLGLFQVRSVHNVNVVPHGLRGAFADLTEGR